VNAWPVPGARRIAFRFGLTGLRWGDEGPAVLLLRGRDDAPAILAQLIGPLVASGRQVIALDDPSDAAAPDEARTLELACAIAEAAVEIRELETIVGHGLGAAAAAQAPASELRVPVLSVRDAVTRDQILDFLLERVPMPLAA
jgi:hypothetical protein